MALVLVAYFFAVMLPDREYPLLVGGYAEWAECASVREWLDQRGYETSSCGLMPLPQEAIKLSVLELPHEE